MTAFDEYAGNIKAQLNIFPVWIEYSRATFNIDAKLFLEESKISFNLELIDIFKSNTFTTLPAAFSDSSDFFSINTSIQILDSNKTINPAKLLSNTTVLSLVRVY